MGLRDTLQSLVNKDYDELIVLAKMAMVDVLPYCKKVDEENEGIVMLTSILMAAVATDGKLSGLESKFIGELTGLDSDKILALASSSPAKTAELVDRFADVLSAEGKASVCMLVATVMACDERISAEENAYIQKILE